MRPGDVFSPLPRPPAASARQPWRRLPAAQQCFAAGALAADDPIHEAIAAHKQAMEAYDASWQKVERAGDAADEAGLAYGVRVGSATADSISRLHELLPGSANEELRRQYSDALDRLNQERLAFEIDRLGRHPDKILAEVASNEWAAYRRFAETVPTTLNGLFVKLSHLGELVADETFEALEDSDMTRALVESLAQCSTIVGAR
jgi:hypothetical protein